MRWANVDGAMIWADPLAELATPTRRALTSEVGFSEFCQLGGTRKGEVDEGVRGRALQDGIRRLSPYATEGLDLSTPLSPAELVEVEMVRDRLLEFFAGERSPRMFRPVFPGCGYLDGSEGDVLCNGVLFEVKTVDRRYRSAEFRQLLTYSALNFVSHKYDFDRVGICNPRRGTFLVVSLSDLAHRTAGVSAPELFETILFAVTDAGISR